MEALRQKIDKFAASERDLVNDGLRIEKLHEHRVIVSGVAIATASLLVRLGITLWVRRAGRLRSGRNQAGVPVTRLLADWTPVERQRLAPFVPKRRDRILRARRDEN